MYTLDAAYSAGEEDLKGSIEEGKLADFTVVSRDPAEAAPSKLAQLAVEMVFVGGKLLKA